MLIIGQTVNAIDAANRPCTGIVIALHRNAKTPVAEIRVDNRDPSHTLFVALDGGRPWAHGSRVVA